MVVRVAVHRLEIAIVVLAALATRPQHPQVREIMAAAFRHQQTEILGLVAVERGQ
jgi:hypothetical protein